MEPDPVIALLKVIGKAEVSIMVQNELDKVVPPVKLKTTTKNSRRGDRFSFGLAEIPVGTTLTYKDDKSKIGGIDSVPPRGFHRHFYSNIPPRCLFVLSVSLQANAR